MNFDKCVYLSYFRLLRYISYLQYKTSHMRTNFCFSLSITFFTNLISCTYKYFLAFILSLIESPDGLLYKTLKVCCGILRFLNKKFFDLISIINFKKTKKNKKKFHFALGQKRNFNSDEKKKLVG